MPAELLKPYGLLTYVMSPSARRKALIRALEYQHKRDPDRYDQTDLCSCALATADHLGLFKGGCGMSAAEDSLMITPAQADRVFGMSPRYGTAQDAADRLKAVHAELAV